jgi:hypothetical protein
VVGGVGVDVAVNVGEIVACSGEGLAAAPPPPSLSVIGEIMEVDAIGSKSGVAPSSSAKSRSPPSAPAALVNPQKDTMMSACRRASNTHHV